MAKIECKLRGGVSTIAEAIDDAVLSGSMTASMEEESTFTLGNAQCIVRVYERYSWTGKNRVSLSVTLLGDENETFLSAISTGGSQAMFFKINTFGEEAFLDTIRDTVSELVAE